MPEVPQFILEWARANAGLFTADEVAKWPAGLLEELVSAGVLSPDKPAPTIACDACGDDHVESVQYIQSPPAAGLRAYIPCPRNGRVLVPLERLRRWSINMTMFAFEPIVRTAHPASSQLPHALLVAHAELVGALTQAEDLYRKTLRFPNPGPVLDAIERFVHELSLVSNWIAELQRRGSLVEERCRSGSKYGQARETALQSHTATPQVLCGAKLALERLRNPGTQNCLFLQNVIDVRKSIASLLADSTAGLSPNAIAAFGAWRDECRVIQLDVERLHVDGCWYLLHIYQASAPGCTDRDQAARAILQTNMGGAHLTDLLAAAESIVAWIIETPLGDEAPQVIGADGAAADSERSAPERVWPAPAEHTTAKVWTRNNGVLYLSTKTDGIHDGRAEFAPNLSGELTYQMRFMQFMCFKYPATATLAEVIEQVYPDEYAQVRADPAALKNTLRKLRSLVSDVRTKKLAKAGLNPDILPPLSVEAAIDTGIGLRLAHLHQLDDKELDQADEA